MQHPTDRTEHTMAFGIRLLVGVALFLPVIVNPITYY